MATLMRAEVSIPVAKQFLGGWRNRMTGVLYYNASTQTNKYGRKGQHISDHETQTRLFADKSTCTTRDAKVQVDFLPSPSDIIIEARPTPYQVINPQKLHWDFHKKMIESAVKIQRFYRNYRRQKNLENTRKTSKPRTLSSKDPERDICRDFAILNHKSPRTRADFELLQNLLDRWRLLECERAAGAFSGSSRIALSSLILSKEVELLGAIGSMKTLARRQRGENIYRKFLDELSKPITWRSSAGERILVETPRVLRARAYKDVFLLLEKSDLPACERMNQLHRAREIALTHTCKHSRRLLRLIDQEVAMLATGVDGSRLACLRDRLKMAFLRLSRDALRNNADEDASWFEKPSKKLCGSCRRLLPIEKFPGEGRRSSSGCNYCQYLRATREPRVVYEPYARMLRDVRRAEGRMGCYTSPAFAIRPEVVYQLVNDVWHGKSAISENDNFDELRLVRLYKDIEWSPWNCLLLTAKEARVHRMIDDPELFYGPDLFHSFRTKNLMAKLRFKSILDPSYK